ncbi:MAG: hypothetical protein ACHQ1D_04440 [Nitrososphaerales archaeon]
MKREGHENIRFFVGPEVEHTPAFSKRTLFVIGKQDIDKIVGIARENKVTHIFMGANHSFDVDPTDGTHYWDLTIQSLLNRGYWVTLDYPAHQHESVLRILSNTVWTSRMFVPLLSVRIPKIQTSSINLTVKIDDVDFKGSNPGVWCMHYHEVTDSNRFTDWVEYGNDFVVNEIVVEPTPTPAEVYAATPVKVEPVEVKPARVSDTTVIKNDSQLGLDPDAKSMLKGEPEKIMEKLNLSAVDAAEAYADGAKEDPLGKEASKKAKK